MTTLLTTSLLSLALMASVSSPRLTVSPRVCQAPCSIKVSIWLDTDDTHRGMFLIWPDGQTFRELTRDSRRSWEFDVGLSLAGTNEIQLQIYDSNGLHDSRSQTVTVVGQYEQLVLHRDLQHRID